jgi:predicted lipid-binding transport protein (Tim44 family)
VKAAGWVSGLVVLGGLIVLSVAGMTAAVGVLVTVVAIVGMLALGNLLGGRTTPERRPYQVDRNSKSEGSGDGAPET